MKSFDIAIYGHLSYDNIYEGFNYKSSVGCMGNVWNQLKIINPDLKVKLEPTDIGESLILADVEQCKRTSVSRLSLKTQAPSIHDSKVSHVMYINELSDTSFIKDLKGFVTADVCNGKSLNLNDKNLQYIDLLLISDEDMFVDIATLCSVIRGSVLMHYPTGSTLYKQDLHFTKQNATLVSGINVLGAGDKLAAYILAGLLDSTNALPKVIQHAHSALTNYYINEKI
jgi:hypothetical protein